MRRALLLLAPALLLAAPVTTAVAATGIATPAKTPVAVGTGGGVASESVEATQAGISVLKNGGNAIDAAVATAATLGATEPSVAGPGGGGFMVIYLAKTKQLVTIDGREMCPARCTPELFVDPKTGAPLDFELARHSGISVGVPGMVAQWAKAVRLYGTKSFGSDLQPAIRVATDGFPVSVNFHQSEVSTLTDLQSFSSSRKLLLTPDGQPLPVGAHFVNPDLARTYQLLAQHGPGYLYTGPLAQAIARTVQSPPVTPDATITVLPGMMTTKDLSNYVARNRRPTHVTYRGLDVYGMAPPSSGGTTMGEALNILSGWPLGAEPRSQALFHYLESTRLAFADRNAYVGDPDYVPVPTQGLLDKQFAATRRCLVHGTALTSPVAPGSPYPPFAGCSTTNRKPTTPREGMQTNHLVTSDRWGNVVSYTNTIEQLFGSGITVPGYGFLLNNEMTDFDFAPPAPGGHDPNLPAPGKRPRSSMSPTIVLRGGTPWLALGSPGGSTIITTTLQTLINRVDFGMTMPQAIAAPRASQRNGAATDVEPAFAAQPYANVLTRTYGENLSVIGPPSFDPPVIGFVNALEFLGGGRVQAATEPARLGGGSAMVVNPNASGPGR
ncbi:MAG: gamma-glutamyltransferase [Pseudonocardiales bacterium]|nr:MAG: gamma-glutamyltransferase [Pseudonocardiales bacterium]